MTEKRILNAEEMLPVIVGGAEDKKASDICILDMRGISTVADYFFICSASNPRQVKAISEEIRQQLEEYGCRPVRVEGVSESRWAVLDYLVILVHVFLEEVRDYYALGSLWGDARRISPEEL